MNTTHAHAAVVASGRSRVRPPAAGSSFTAGVAVGYLAYVGAHYAAHHLHFASGTFLARLKRRHVMHHHGDAAANFGVTTPLWDRVFRTALARDTR